METISGKSADQGVFAEVMAAHMKQIVVLPVFKNAEFCRLILSDQSEAGILLISHFSIGLC